MPDFLLLYGWWLCFDFVVVFVFLGCAAGDCVCCVDPVRVDINRSTQIYHHQSCYLQTSSRNIKQTTFHHGPTQRNNRVIQKTPSGRSDIKPTRGRQTHREGKVNQRERDGTVNNTLMCLSTNFTNQIPNPIDFIQFTHHAIIMITKQTWKLRWQRF